MEIENLKKILKDAAVDRNRQFSRWRYHIAKHPEEYNIYIELKVLTTNFGGQRAFEIRTIFVINVCRAALS